MLINFFYRFIKEHAWVRVSRETAFHNIVLSPPRPLWVGCHSTGACCFARVWAWRVWRACACGAANGAAGLPGTPRLASSTGTRFWWCRVWWCCTAMVSTASLCLVSRWSDSQRVSVIGSDAVGSGDGALRVKVIVPRMAKASHEKLMRTGRHTTRRKSELKFLLITFSQ